MPHSVALARHSGTSSEAVRGIEARVSWTPAGGLAFTYIFKGDLARVRIPPPRRQQRADRLWQRTCFEAFVSVKGEPAYREFNFAPSGEWAVYDFQRYRVGGRFVEEGSAPHITLRRTSASLELNAVVAREGLPAIPHGARLKLALCAVIEEENGMLSYWALSHPPGKPDFHHPDGFGLEIEPPIPSPSPACGRGKG